MATLCANGGRSVLPRFQSELKKLLPAIFNLDLDFLSCLTGVTPERGTKGRSPQESTRKFAMGSESKIALKLSSCGHLLVT